MMCYQNLMVIIFRVDISGYLRDVGSPADLVEARVEFPKIYGRKI